MVELALEMSNRILVSVVWGVTVTRGEVQEEGLVGGNRVLDANPVHGAVGKVANKDVARVSGRWQSRIGVLEQRRVPLVRVAAKEAVEVLEAQAPGPLVEGPRRALHPLRHQVVLAEPRRVVAVVHERVANGSCSLGNDRGVARIPRGELRYVAHADAVVVAAGEECGPRGRAQGGGVEIVVGKAALGYAVESWRGDWHAEGAGCRKAGVISHDEQHVGSARGSLYAPRKVRFGITTLAPDHAAKARLGVREDRRTSRVLSKC